MRERRGHVNFESTTTPDEDFANGFKTGASKLNSTARHAVPGQAAQGMPIGR